MFVEKQAPSEMLQKHSFIVINDAGKMAAKGQQHDTYVRVTSRNLTLAHMTDFM